MMRSSAVKRIVIPVLILAVLGAGAFAFFGWRDKAPAEPETFTNQEASQSVIGTSVEGRDITAYRYGNGATKLAFIGGIHGGYEWNSVLLAYQLMDYLKANPQTIPDNITVTVIPSANPDGVYKVVGTAGRFSVVDAIGAKNQEAGRFNAHEVDLNRNFDCKWKKEGTWRGKTVSAGTSAFSEPEARAIRDFMVRERPAAAVFFHSQANAVYASECEEGILPETLKIMNAYSRAAGYPAVDSFDAYEVTGDVEGWLASVGIPAITVELKTHETLEWSKNLAGVRALFAYYKK